MGQQECLSWAKGLFNELGSWRDKSQKEFSNIIDSHNSSIIKGISDLVAEVCRLQSQLSITTTEKNNLVEMVKIFSDEIRELKSELTILQPLPEPEVTHHQEQDTHYVEVPIAQDQDEEALCIGNNTEEDELPLNYENYLNETTCYKMLDGDANEEDEIDWEEEEPSLETIRSKKEGMTVDSTSNKTLQFQQKCNNEDTLDYSKFANISGDLICPECHIVFSTKENVKIHMENVHSKLELTNVCPVDREESKEHTDHLLQHQDYVSEDITPSRAYKLHKVSVNPDVVKSFQCEGCPFKTNNRRNLNQHINGVHNKNHVCIECGKSYRDKRNLKEHREVVHLGNKKFKCEQCPYTSGCKQNLKKHIKAVHEKIRRFVCEKCSYTATTKDNLMYHTESVHKIGDKKFKCEKCAYTSASKGNLKRHTESVHKKFKCDLCPYQCHLQHILNRHAKNVHL